MPRESNCQKTNADRFEAVLGALYWGACEQQQFDVYDKLEEFLEQLIDREVFPIIGMMVDGVEQWPPRFTGVPSKYSRRDTFFFRV